MTRNLTTTFQQHIQGQVTTLAHVLRITLRNGRQIGFTTHDQPLTIAGVTYSPNNSLEPSASQTTLESVGNNQEVTGYFTTDALTEQDLLNGSLDDATYLLGLVNWAAPSLSPGECIVLSTGRLGKITADDQTYKIEALSLTEILKEDRQARITTQCTAEFGDNLCKKNLGSYSYTATVTASTKYGITVNALPPNVEFRNGLVSLGSQQHRISGISAANIRFALPLFTPIPVGTVVTLIAGCDKSIKQCRDTYQNVINFRGFPHLPTKDSAIQGPRKGSTIKSNWASDTTLPFDINL